MRPHFYILQNKESILISSKQHLPKNLKKLEGPTFKLQLTLAESIMTEDTALQASIQFNNEYTSYYLNKFVSKAKTIENWITNREEEKFTKF